MTRLLSALLLVFVAFACAQVTPVVEAPVDAYVRPLVIDRTLHGDTRFEPLERYITEAKADELHEFTRGRARVAIPWDLDEHTLMALADRPRLLRKEWWQAPGGVGGNCTDGVTRLVPANCPAFGACVAHELGHFVGMQHLAEEERGVMSARNPEEHFTSADRRECTRIGLCEEP